jgi:SAM-dependent methyltransferase
MRVDDGFTDPRLAATYDIENAGRRDDIDFYVELARDLDAHDVIDLGCGTGVLATELARRGHAVVGIDPAEAMLEIGRRRTDGDRVTWVRGSAEAMATSSADLVVMSGHVSQVFVEDAEWVDRLTHIHRALRPGRHLAFEMRDPKARAWRSWTRAASERTYEPPGDEAFTSWVEVTAVDGRRITFDSYTTFARRGEELVASTTLRFRTREELEASLAATGFHDPAIYGTWNRGPVTAETSELIVVAARP